MDRMTVEDDWIEDEMLKANKKDYEDCKTLQELI